MAVLQRKVNDRRQELMQWEESLRKRLQLVVKMQESYIKSHEGEHRSVPTELTSRSEDSGNYLKHACFSTKGGDTPTHLHNCTNSWPGTALSLCLFFNSLQMFRHLQYQLGMTVTLVL